MANRLELPQDLTNLIEKREQAERRQTTADDQPQTADGEPSTESAERRSGADRRAEE